MKITEKFLLDSYSGRGGFETGEYLVRHTREGDDEYTRRKELCVYPNYVRTILDLYLSFLFAPPIIRESANTVYQEFIGKADTVRGLSDVMRMAWLQAMRVGTVAIIIDRPASQAVTAADEQALIPYLARRAPSQVNRILLDDAGLVAEAVFIEGMERYRWYTSDGWKLTTDPDGLNILASGEYSLGRPPVVLLHSTEPEQGQWRATSWHYDIARLNYDLFNQVSELRELLRSQAFAVLCVPVSDTNLLNPTAGATSDADIVLNVGPEHALLYDAKGGGAPSYISPQPTAIDAYMATIQDLRDQIYKTANMEFLGGAGSGNAASSGVALEYRFQMANKTLADMAARCEAAERQIAALVCAWAGQEFDGQVAYSRDFSIPSLLNDMKVAMDALDLRISPTFDGELKKRLAREILDRRANENTFATIDAEIDADTDPYGDRVAQAAATGIGE